MPDDYTLTRLPPTGDADKYEIRFPDGSVSRFMWSGAQKARDHDGKGFQRWLKAALKRGGTSHG